ncbi:hypothetical protein Curi_c03100 [Gottschalkia acidurici 9a]|uniref:Uncharacterized protein n=1 Tax=Gottschalkia acidurici (strain ATCC 7906 / DSM 604 / BCRC 14475 / CIP 104303 / KCTC 5404 / NCIMB 10678 / 9a) TaxID=1128398 RepID=K0AXE9_GOTA9|nr:hypothetical protein [Gottschalkia acidurici]AFS77390.1 hypothetical protein Curi_c03100 [Gottschalkia acidurici 9a]
MNLEYLYLLSFILFYICFISIGYIAISSMKSPIIFKNIINYEAESNRFLNYNIYLEKMDYIPYEKYEIWRFYFPA